MILALAEPQPRSVFHSVQPRQSQRKTHQQSYPAQSARLKYDRRVEYDEDQESLPEGR
jgi:hypothetical protein